MSAKVAISGSKRAKCQIRFMLYLCIASFGREYTQAGGFPPGQTAGRW